MSLHQKPLFEQVRFATDYCNQVLNGTIPFDKDSELYTLACDLVNSNQWQLRDDVRLLDLDNKLTQIIEQFINSDLQD